MAEDRRKKALEILSNGNRQTNVSNAQKTTAFAPSTDISGRRKKALDILAGNNTDRKTESQTKTWSQMIDEYNADIDRRKKTEGQAKSSIVSFDEKGNVSPWQTLLNIGSDLKKISGTEEERTERAKTLSDKRDRRVEEYKAKGYNTIWLFGREYILGKIKDEDISEEEKKEKSESAAKWEARNEVDRKEIENISTAVEAAKKLGQQGIPTYAVKGSKTQQSVDDFQNKYAGKSFGEKLRSNVGITAGNWALDISSAALSGADLLTGGQLGKGKLGKASSVYSVLNLAQSGASGLAGNAFGIMRENSSFLGKLVLDIEKSGVEQILDRLTGGGLATMGVRVAGGTLQQGENKGLPIGKNILTTAVRTGIEVFTEMMSGIGGSYTGKGWGDSILDALNRKIAAKTGSELLGTLAEAFGGEAVEEMTSDILNPIFDWIFGLEGEEYEGALDFIGSTLYDGLVGGLSGMTGGVGTAAMDRFSARQLGADIATYKVAQHIVESDRLRKNFEKATGVLLSEDEGEALVQTAVVLTAMSENRKQTRNADRNIRSRKTEVIEESLKKLGVSERAAKIIRADFLLGDAAPEAFAHGVEEAFTYGKNGISLEEAKQRGSFINDLSEVQARHAYELGQMTRNTRTEEPNSAKNGDMEGTAESIEPNLVEELTVDSAAASYGEDAEKFIDAFVETPEADIEEFARDFKKAYNFGLSGMNKTSLTGAETLTESQRETAYSMGRAKSAANAQGKQESINAGKQSGNRHREGTVRGDGVKLADLRAHFNDKQNTAYRFLATFAKISGIDIVLYKSEADGNGNFTAPAGRFEPGENTIYIDINAGLESIKDVSSLSNYTMLRTFSHEFTHFVEKWSPEQYNTLREFTFRYMDENGKNVDSLIMDKMSLDESLSYEEASREVAAEGFADILPQSDIVERLAAEHESLYKSILRKMKEFVARIKAYFNGLKETTPEAQALKNGITYAEEIVKLWTDAGADAVNSYNATFGEETSQSLHGSSNRRGTKGIADRGIISSYDNFTGEDADRTLDEYGGDLLSYEDDTEDEPEKRKVSRDRFPANDYTSREEEAPDLLSMVERKPEAKTVGRDYFPQNDYTSQAEDAPRLADRVPKKTAVSVAEMVETGNFEAEEEAAEESSEGETKKQAKTEKPPAEESASEAVPPKDETEEAKDWLKEKAKFGKLGEAGKKIFEWLKNKTLTADNITLIGKVDGFNNEQRAYLAKELIEGTRTDNATIRVSVPFDGKFEIRNDARAVTEVLESLKVRVMENSVIGKKLDSVLKYSGDIIGVIRGDGVSFITDGKFAAKINEETAELAAADETYGKRNMPLDRVTPLKSAMTETGAKLSMPREGKISDKTPVYAFETENGIKLFNKKYVDYFDGNNFELILNGNALKVTDENGDFIGCIMQITPRKGMDVSGWVSAALKSFKEKPKSRFSKYNKKELENGTEAVDQGREDIRGRSSGRGVSKSAGEVSEPESDIPGDRGSGETDERDNAPTGGGNEARRNGSGDRAGDGDRLLAGGNEGNAGTLDGEDHAGVQRDVPVTRNANNHRITEDIDSIRPNFDDNLAAIKLIKKLIAEGRKATPEERAILARYKGWGGLKNYILGYRGRELERILTKEEFQAAKDSILNAHYTSTKVISGIYNALRKMGFKGGKILEPSMGVGNFFGMLPQEMSEKSELYGVELDSITGQIAQQLYPDAKIDVAGFQDVLYPDNTFDVVVGNVPFSNDIKLSYRGSTYNLHDFFFVKALDEVREGGVMALITSTGTLDKLSGKTQAALAKKANLLAAFRLPDNAFKTNAGTSVTTDLIFLQKRGNGVEDNGIAFGRVDTIDGIPINEYFVEHPENILGTLAQEKNMYGSDRTVVHATENFEELFAKAMDSLPKNIFGAKKSQQSGTVKAKRRGESKKAQFVITESGAELVDSEGNSEKILGKTAVKVKDFVTIRELFNTLSELEKSGNLEAAEEFRKKLNAAYDSFVRKHGTLASNKSTLRKDDSYTRISGLEIIDKNGNASKSVIFSRPTMYKPKKTSASTAAEGLSVSLNERGRVDVPFIAELTGKSEEEVADELSGEIIYTPDGEFDLIAKYISGNIYKKLDALKGKKGFERQRKLLEAALPKPKTASEIDAELSSHWIPEKYMAQFLNEILTPYGGVHVHYIKETGQWTVDKFYSSVRKFTADGISIADLVAATMNNKNVVINEKNADGKSVIDKERTEVAQNKQNDLRQAFRQWIFRDETRRKDLESIYNRAMNAVAPMNYDTLADKLNFGVSSASKIKLRSYQKEAAARIVFGGNTLLHHGVGTGKTSTMIAAAKLLKDTGIANKPMFVVPNGKVEDFKREILDMYPEANILALSDTQMTPKELQRTKSLIATNDWDYVLIYRTAFQKIGVSDAQTAAFIEEQLDALETAIREAKGDSNRNLSTRAEKGLISRKKNLEEKLKTILEKPKDSTTTFEDMGVDALFIDEAHNFKKVGFATTHEISGVDSETNQITTDLYLKERYMRSIGGRIVLATATPITNTVSEMYNMTLHVAPEVLEEAGIYSFDAWLNTFGNMETAWEISPDGKSYRQKERVQSFRNGNELVGLYRQFADVKQTQDVVEGLPKAEYITVISEATDLQKALMQNFSERFAKPHRFGDSGEDSILTINNDARAAATDIRLVFGALGSKLFPGLTGKEMDLPNSKINKAVANIVDEYMRSKKNKGTQFVFLDQGINDGGKRYSFNLYKDLISKLVASGIPRSEIANIGDYDGEAKRTELYEAMNTGKIRVLIGSTAKMGEGVNAQNKAVALHHLSVPYRPDNLEQREGRIIRHGNENGNVRIYKYIQEGSYDSYLWQMIERKAKYMAQALNGGDASQLEEAGDAVVNAAEAKALATGNPKILDKLRLEDEVAKLRTLERSFFEEQRQAEKNAAKDKIALQSAEASLKQAEKTAETVRKNRTDSFSMEVAGKVYDKRADAAKALAKAYGGKSDALGKVFGLEMRRDIRSEEDYGVSIGSTRVQLGNSEEGNITRILNAVKDLENEPARIQRKIKELEIAIRDAEATAARESFPQAAELAGKTAELKAVNEELGITEKTAAFDADGEKTQYSLRRVSPVQPTSSEWERTSTTEEALKAFPNMWNVAAEESETRNPTQISSTVSTYRKIFDILKAHGFKGTILDASSGMGIGTRTGREEYGFSVDDIEPFPGNGYKPMFTDYSTLNKKYDVIISSAVLNVLPQDQRDALVVKMGQLLKEGGKMFITTRGKDVDNLAKTGKNIHLGNMEWIETVKGSYQKGFTNPELIAYLRDALGEGFDVAAASRETGGKFNNNTNVVVTKLSDTQFQQRGNSISDSDVLEYAVEKLDTAKLTDAERYALNIFKRDLERLRELEADRAEQGRLYKEQMFTKGGSHAEAVKTKNRMDILDRKINSLRNTLLMLQNKEVLRKILSQARTEVEGIERAKAKERLAAFKMKREDTESRRKYRKRVETEVTRLSDMLLKPADKNISKRVPAAIQKTVSDLLSSIDFSTPRLLKNEKEAKLSQKDKAFAKKLQAVQNAIKENIELKGAYSGYADLPPNFMEDFQKLIDGLNDLISTESENDVFVVNRMSAKQLKDLSSLLKDVRKYIENMNRFHENAIFQHAYEAGEDTVQHLRPISRAEQKKGPLTRIFNNFLAWQYMRPAVGFERFGKGGMSIYHEFREGQATQAFLANKIIEFAKETYTEKQVREWSEKTVSVELDSGETVTMPVAMAMSFYELAKRPQAKTHIFGDGIRIAAFEDGKKLVQDEGHIITIEDAQRIGAALKDEQIKVADALQAFMRDECAAWGNYVTMARFEREVFGEEWYFPINSDGRYLAATAEESPDSAALYALLNMGFTKELKENAKNRIIIYNIFDVFANHAASMAQYRAFALPVLDALKWFNYSDVDTSVRDEMAKAFGVPTEKRPGSGNKGYAESFVLNLLKAYNGTTAHSDSYDAFGMKGLHRFNRAQVAYNLRVVAQQPLAITRAAMILPPAKLTKGLGMSATQLKKLAEEMEAHSGIAAWKKLGFYDTNISRGLTALIKHEETFGEKFTEVGMSGAELADRYTWAAMWYAAKDTISRADYSSEEAYFKAVTDLFEQVIYKTQVVDSVLTKSEFLRAQGFGARFLGSFMSEPSATVSMLMDGLYKYADDMARGMSRSTAWQRNKEFIGKTFLVYGVGQVLLAAVQSVADAWRDDDDYESFLEKLLEAFKGNVIDELNPIGKIPIAKDAIDLIKTALSKIGFDTYGNSISGGWMQYADYLIKSVEIFHGLKTKDDRMKYTLWGGIYNLLRGVAGMTGYPIATLSREVIDAWNNIVGAFRPDMKIKTYDPGDKNEIKYAYQDGYLTREEAMNELVRREVSEDRNEAFFTVESWDSGELSVYAQLYEAAESGDTAAFNSEMRKLTTHGKKKEEVIQALRQHVRDGYLEGSMTASKAKSLLTRFTDDSPEDADARLDNWDFSENNPSLDWEYATVNTYLSEIKPSGISMSVYDKYLKGYRKCTGEDANGDGKTDSGSKRKQVLSLIDSLDLTPEQKDVLYYKNNYAASRINEAPWR